MSLIAAPADRGLVFGADPRIAAPPEALQTHPHLRRKGEHGTDETVKARQDSQSQIRQSKPSEYGTDKTVTARFWSWLPGKSNSNL